MSDDEGFEGPTTSAQSASKGDIKYVAGDTTVEIPYPPRRCCLLPSAALTDAQYEARVAAALRFFSLPHPRHSEDLAFCLCPTGPTTSTLCFMQGQVTDEDNYASWAMNDRIEPDGQLYIATPYDLVYTAIWVLAQQAEKPLDEATVSKLLTDPTVKGPLKFKDLPTLLMCDARLRTLEAHGLLAALETAMAQVADVEEISDDDKYYRLSMPKLAAFVKNHFSALASSDVFKSVVYPPLREEARAPVPSVETKKNSRKTARDLGDDASSSQPGGGTPRRQPTAETIRQSSHATESPADAGASPRPLEPSLPVDVSFKSVDPKDSESFVVGPSTSAPADDDFLLLRAFHLVVEWIPKTFHAALAKHCDVCQFDSSAATNHRVQATRQANNSMLAAEDEAVFGTGAGGPDSKRNRPEASGLNANAKSASVKKLEKAGPPKGTPSLMAMFAKKTPK
jgi:hypothetical protein